MLFRILLLSTCIIFVSSTFTKQKITCLSGYMTDRQQWVNRLGCLTNITKIPETIDVSKNLKPLEVLQLMLLKLKSPLESVKYLSMAHCKLKVAPDFSPLINFYGIIMNSLIEHLTLYGNEFNSRNYITGTTNNNSDIPLQVEDPGVQWYEPFRNQMFPNLRELDLRACSIEVVDDMIFANMPKLEFLYMGENRIKHVNAYAFDGLNNLVHLDMSRNIITDVTEVITFNSRYMFMNILTLESLDFSYTKLMDKNMQILRKLSPNMKSISICESGLTKLDPYMFNGTSMTILDVSGNPGILNDPETLFGTESTLEILYADNVNLKSFEVFKGLRKLEVLKLSNNDLSFIRPETAASLSSLKVLDLDLNRIQPWQTPTFSSIETLEFLSLQKNNINYLSGIIIDDISNVKYIGLLDNNVVCNCYTKNVIATAYKNDHCVVDRKKISFYNKNDKTKPFHTAYIEFINKVLNRVKIVKPTEIKYDENALKNITGNFVLYDYTPNDYKCFIAKEGTTIPYYLSQCDINTRSDYFEDLEISMMKLVTIPCVIVPALVLMFVFKRHIRFCFITLRNTAMIAIMHKPIRVDDGTIFNYDVFVSYCHDDRSWVLDQFLPHIERDSGITVCLHERDFQVGLSILENIVSCMDRSRTIMLILSQRFMKSQWCQFEMHLAQHRLLETRREDLLLILLEEIPRQLRPNTLHFLMLTKTYIVWPCDENQQTVFWRRLAKSIVKQKIVYSHNESMV